ncbi:MAG TPA: GNAT family N-acetyltransferase [Gemmatimonas sp.]|nr:GNAT family N-acetyltransferase [Gemmatimonas sp.]
MDIVLRPLHPLDSLDELTELLHAAYGEHAAAGRQFFASYQTSDDTRRRVARGECWVAYHDDALVGTVTVAAPYAFPDGYPALARTATFYQLAVLPTYQRRGLGERLLDLAESQVRAAGLSEIAIDTSDRATDLIEWYVRRGYRAVGRWKWSVTNYDSVVLGKHLEATDSPQLSC